MSKVQSKVQQIRRRASSLSLTYATSVVRAVAMAWSAMNREALRERFAPQLAAVVQSMSYAGAAVQPLAKFIQRGWRVVTEVHTIRWLIADVFGVTVPPIAFMIWADSYGLRTPLVGATAPILFGILTLAFLAYLGYRDENPRDEVTSPSNTSVE